MFLRSGLLGVSLILLQYASAAPQAADTLQQRYLSAQSFQRDGKLSEAARQYRGFLADALGQLALGYAIVPDYAHAAPLFDEALGLEPNSPTLLLDYARTALRSGDFAHARTLASEFVEKYPENRAKLAEAHQVLGRALLKLNLDQQARKELETAVALDPTFANGYDLAVACLDLDDEKCAVQIFGEMERSFGDTAEIHLAFGRAYGDSDFQPRAIAEFRRAIEENPRLPGAHYLLAAVLLATGNEKDPLQSAEAELNKELVNSPRDAMTYAALGRINVTRANYSEAERYLKKAISLDAQSPDAYLYMGQMYFDTNRMDDSEAALRKSIALTTDVSRNRYQVQKAHYLLGRILMKKGQQDAAHTEMQIERDLADRTLAQDKSKLAGLMDTSGSEGSSVTASAVVAPGREDQAAMRKVEAMREKVKPAVADGYNNLGAIAATNNDYSSASTYFERASEWNPSLEGLDYNWGRAAFAGGQYATAIPPLLRYVKSHPDDVGGRSVLGLSQFLSGKYPDCIVTLKPLMGRTDLAPQVEYAYAESLVESGDVAAGTQSLLDIERAHSEVPEVHRALGEAFDRQGDQKRAVEELQTAIRLSPQDGEAHYHLGRIELAGGESAQAIPELEAAVRLAPNNKEFHHELADAYTAVHRTADAEKEMATYSMLGGKAVNAGSSNP
ncbi:MAG TPA: tetratricopeptide repeat protein [Bryocella sp.]|nr:tetratricopeptide repeat protein [Bryocella sp.]